MRSTTLAVTFACVAFAFAVGATLAGADPGGASAGGAGPGMSSGATRDPAQEYQAGVTALQANDYRVAIRHLREAQRAVPNEPAVNYALGLAYVGNREPRPARQAFERAVRSDTAPPGARLQLGLVYLELGDRERALEQQTALQTAVAQCNASCGDERRAQLQAALDQLTRALTPPDANAPPAADPAATSWNFPSVDEGRQAYGEAVGLINQERFVEALNALERTRAAIGPHPDVLNYMGFASRKLGRFDDALAYYNQALRLDPGHLGATEYLGELYIQMGQMDRARSQLARLDQLCAYGCSQREDLARWIATAE